jgi:prepilin-type N-terminal cleavage/methylation domain-containing protein
MNNYNMKKNKGFTLIELMIVVAIIGILSAVALPQFANLIRKSNEGATKGNLGSVRSALYVYYGEQEGRFPVNNTTNPLSAILTMENGKYLKSVPICYCPPYFGKNSIVTTLLTTGTNSGTWAYQDNPAPAATNKGWGEFWVDCSQTDTKGSGWDCY